MPATRPADLEVYERLASAEQRLLNRLDQLEAALVRRLDALAARLSPASTHDRMRACEHPGMPGGDAR